uniref:Uncharacterized protein LOC104215416 isoform X7 n=1 Tax=Nicotiana sylvestris TaxID=4096 RepID=A0A1U7VAX7_NICSY|nr:PREDICTED: uncharacterized protein LOC104215416 isoform X7 [Nicotiana sylvestris]
MSILLNQHLSSNFAAGASCSLPKTATNECEVCTPPAVLHKVLHQALQMSQVLYPLSRFWLTDCCYLRSPFRFVFHASWLFLTSTFSIGTFSNWCASQEKLCSLIIGAFLSRGKV